MTSYTGTNGDDRLTGTNSSDTFTYDVSNNRGSHDSFNAGAGNDTLVLRLTRADWFNNTLQNDIAELLRYLNSCGGNSGNFKFDAFGLTIKNFEAVKIFVDGVELTAADNCVRAYDDAFVVQENGSVSASVLANDSVADLVRNVAVVRGPNAGRLNFNADGTFTFNTDNKFDWLGAGQTTSVSFTYRVTDADGDQDTATVTFTVTGANDAPVITGGISSGTITELADNAVGENQTLHLASGSIAFADADLSDQHTASFTALASGYVGTFSLTLSEGAEEDDEHHTGFHHHRGGGQNGHGCNDEDEQASAGSGALSWRFTVADSAIDFLAAGQVLIQNYLVTVRDGRGGTAQQTIVVTIFGSADNVIVNAAPNTANTTSIGNEDATLSIVLSGSDLDGTVSSFKIATLPDNGTLYKDAALTLMIASGDTVAATANAATVYFRPLANSNGTTNFQFSAIDNVGVVDATPATATLTVNAVNDAAVIGGDTIRSLVEGNSVLSTSGHLVAADIDNPANLFQIQNNVLGSNGYGHFNIASDGSWTYATTTAHDEFRKDVLYSDQITVKSEDGTEQLLSVNITGTNDVPVLAPISVTLTVLDGVFYGSEPPLSAHVSLLPYIFDPDTPLDEIFVTAFPFGEVPLNQVSDQFGLVRGVGQFEFFAESIATQDSLALIEGEVQSTTYTYYFTDGISQNSDGSFAVSQGSVTLNIEGRDSLPTSLFVNPNLSRGVDSYSDADGALHPVFSSGVLDGAGNERIDLNDFDTLLMPGFEYNFASALGINQALNTYSYAHPNADGTINIGIFVDASASTSYMGDGSEFVGGLLNLDGLSAFSGNSSSGQGLITTAAYSNTLIAPGVSVRHFEATVRPTLTYPIKSSDPNLASTLYVPETTEGGTTLATLQGYDPDHDSQFTYTGIFELFEIVGNELRLKSDTILPTDQATDYQLFVTATDQSGLSLVQYIHIELTDVNDVPVANPLVETPDTFSWLLT